MAEAIGLAKRGWGATNPNPMVGALIVDADGNVVSRGYHAADGAAHAEIACLKNMPRAVLPTDTMYVTLEPCCTKGLTGACTDALISAGIKNVVVGAMDFSPEHSGRGVEVLRSAGVSVQTGILGRECEDLNFIFNHTAKYGRALLAIKYAASKDGKIALDDGNRAHITGKEAMHSVHEWRALFSAIGVGFNTIKIDNPALTVRRDGVPPSCRQRLIFSAELNFDFDMLSKRVFTDEFEDKTRVVCCSDSPQDKIDFLKRCGVKVMQLSASSADRAAFWSELKERLFSEERISSIYVEGGAITLSSIINSHSADYAFVYQSPKVFGENALDALDEKARGSWKIRNPKFELLGLDKLSYGEVEYL